MINHVWSVLCTDTVIDNETNQLSLHSVIEQLTILSSPIPGGLLPHKMKIATLWIRSDANKPCKGLSRVSFISPSGRITGSVEPEIDLSKVERSRNIVLFDAVPIEESGRHIFRIELQNEGEDEWHQVALVPLTIVFSPQENQEATMETE